MRRILGSAMLMFCGCAGPTVLPRTEVPPAAPVSRELPANPPAAIDEAATQQWLEREANRQRGGTARAPGAVPTPRPPQTDEVATSAWLDRTIEERRIANPDVPPVPMVQTVERTVYVDRSGYGGRRHYGYDYDAWGEPIYDHDYWHGPYRHRSTFPINTLFGAGFGAMIGHQSHHRDRGAAIGAGIGLLLDLAH